MKRFAFLLGMILTVGIFAYGAPPGIDNVKGDAITFVAVDSVDVIASPVYVIESNYFGEIADYDVGDVHQSNDKVIVSKEILTAPIAKHYADKAPATIRRLSNTNSYSFLA